MCSKETASFFDIAATRNNILTFSHCLIYASKKLPKLQHSRLLGFLLYHADRDDIFVQIFTMEIFF